MKGVFLTNEQHLPSSPLTADVILRLQQLIANWRGASRGEPLTILHQACIDAVGRKSQLQQRLLPTHLLFVADLDVTRLQSAIRRFNGVGRTTVLEFRVAPSGRFDAALIPVGRMGELSDRFVLAIDKELATQDQVALYGHAVGHLLLNYQEVQMGQRPHLDPRNKFAHADTIAELRLLETVKQAFDRRVLETFPLLTQLLEVPEETGVVFDVATTDLRQQLAVAGWHGQYVQMPYRFTDGRVFPSSSRRGSRLSVDALLRAAASLPIALVQSVRAGGVRDEAIQRIQSHARRLALPYAYLLEEDGTIQEFDWSSSQEPVCSTLSSFPDRETLWNRWAATLQLTDPKHKRVLCYPYRLSGTKRPRYYQEATINRTIIAVLQALHGLRSPRILLTLATGTGKTMVAFQLLWKLKRERAVRNILFLTDRDFLLSQAMDNEFAPFGDGRYRIQGEVSTAYDIVFATYQGITTLDQSGHSRYFHYPPNFFDVIVVDECHRGSAKEASEWRKVLEYFSNAVQIGLTATPLSNETVQTDEYFGEPLYKYSLRMGINDGFLAPYRVRRITMGQTLEEEQLTSPGEQEREQCNPQEQQTSNVVLDEDELSFVDIPASMETPATMRTYTKAIADHLAAFLHRTDPSAKTIVFCVDQAHAEAMRLALIEACAPWAVHRSDYIVRIVSEEGTDGKRTLGNFTTPDEKFPVIVTTSKLLSTGVDVPTCKNIVLARPVGSIVEFKQIIGRGTRLFEPEKRWFTILDYAGTIKHFFDADFDGDPELVEQESLLPDPQSQAEDTMPDEALLSDEEAIPFDIQPTHMQPAELMQRDMSTDEIGQALSSCNTDAPIEASPSVALPFQTVHEPQRDYHPSEVGNDTHATLRDATPHLSGETRDRVEGSEQSTEHIIPTGQRIQSTDTPPQLANEGALADSESRGALDLTSPPAGTHVVTKHTRDGRTLKVVGEVVYELGPDGTTLHRGTYRECAIATMNSLVRTPADLRARWLRDEQRAELLAHLGDEGVDLQELAYQQRLTDLDPLDLLLSLVFQEPFVTRAQRVERLRRDYAAFFTHYEKNLLARAILDVILEKYIKGEAPEISDTELLRVISLADRHTLLELAQPFEDKATNTTVRTVLKELQMLLYSV